jgi:hypothetical protein
MIHRMQIVAATKLLGETVRRRIRGIARTRLRQALNQTGIKLKLLYRMKGDGVRTHKTRDSLIAISAGVRLLGACSL